METTQPFVSIIITAYNAEAFIEASIQSMLSQTYQHFEIIIVDDCSTDGTLEKAKAFTQKDKRVRVYTMPKHKGPSTASNVALLKARGKYIARMDADDISIATRLEKQVAFLETHQDVVIVGGQCVLIDTQNKVIGEKHYPLTHNALYPSLYIMNPIQHPTCMIRREVLQKHNIVYHNHSMLAHDLELVFELTQHGKLANLPDIVLQYRQHKKSLSLRNPKKTFQATGRVRKKAVKEYGYIPTSKGKYINFCQSIVAYLLPNQLIYPLFILWRIQKRGTLFPGSLNTFATRAIQYFF